MVGQASMVIRRECGDGTNSNGRVYSARARHSSQGFQTSYPGGPQTRLLLSSSCPLNCYTTICSSDRWWMVRHQARHGPVYRFKNTFLLQRRQYITYSLESHTRDS